MSYGLQVYDASGNVVVDVTSRLAQYQYELSFYFPAMVFAVTVPAPNAALNKTMLFYRTDSLSESSVNWLGTPAPEGYVWTGGFMTYNYYEAFAYVSAPGQVTAQRTSYPSTDFAGAAAATIRFSVVSQ